MKLLSIILFVLWSGTFRAQKVMLVSKEKGTKIRLLVPNLYMNRVDTTFIGIDSVEYKLKEEENLFYLENKDYAVATHLLIKKEAKVNKGRIIFPSLLAVPHKEKNNNFISIDKISFNVKAKDYKKRYYTGLATYLKDITEHASNMDDGLSVEHSVFEERIQGFLLKRGFVDTTSKLSLGNFNNVELTIIVNSVVEHKFSKYIVVDLAGEIEMDNKVSRKRLEFKTRSSVLHEIESKSNMTIKSLIQEALEKTFLEAYSNPNVKDLFKSNVPSILLQSEKWPIISFNEKPEETNLENSVQAVVTLVQKNGHGSGCIISRNGYIVTNHHVIGADTSDISVLFSNGIKKRCKVVRTNPLYDLALVKVDTVFEHYLKVNKEKNIKVGSEVYAIGTPKDVDLGQSVSKGIISAKRKIEERDYIQTDVSINAGNSGGALTNKAGELIGIVNAKLVGRSVEGVGFAIPSYFIEIALKLELK